MPYKSHDLRECTIGMLNARMSVRAVARSLNVNASTMSGLRHRFEEFGMTTNRPHARRPRVTKPAQFRYIRILNLLDRLRPATATADEAVGLFNRRISPQTVQNRLKEANLRVHRSRRGREEHPQDVSTLEGGRCSSVPSHVSCFTEQICGSVCGAIKGREILTSPSYAGWHTTAVAFWFGREYSMGIACPCWKSDTVIKYCTRSSCPSFARSTPFSGTTTLDLTSPAFAESFWMTKTSMCLIAQHIPLICPR